MTSNTDLVTKPSEPAQVDAYMKKLDHPLAGVVEALRAAILGTDPAIGEEIKWNAPSFFFTGTMKPFHPKEYKRYVIVFNLFRKDCIRLVFPAGAGIADASGLLEGDYADGRRLASFSGMADVQSKLPELQAAIRKWLAQLDRFPEDAARPERGPVKRKAAKR
jgi:hypothetical protein